MDSETTSKIKASAENIEDLFDWCSKQLGEGLHMEFWRRLTPNPVADPLKAKIELFQVLQDERARKNLEEACSARLQQLFDKYSQEIRGLKESSREKYRRIRLTAKDPEPLELIFPETIQITKEKGAEWPDHLYIDKNGKFRAGLNEWEQKVLKAEIEKPGFVGWLRNIPRKQWSLCVPYRMGGEYKGMFPDFIILRKQGRKITVDLFEPHTTSFSDSCHKAVGLAEYAAKHGEFFGRIEIIDIVKGVIKRLNLSDEAVRDKVKRISSNAELEYFSEA